MEDALTATGSYERRDLLASTKLHFWTTQRQVVIAFLMLPVGAVLVYLGFVGLWNHSWLGPACLVMAAVGWTAPHQAQRHFAKQAWNDPHIAAQRRYRLDENGLFIQGPIGERSIQWAGMRRWRRAQELYVIELTSSELVVLPTRFFSSPSIENRVENLLEAELGPRQRARPTAFVVWHAGLVVLIALSLLVVGLAIVVQGWHTDVGSERIEQVSVERR
jgi:hypothetical protein